MAGIILAMAVAIMVTAEIWISRKKKALKALEKISQYTALAFFGEEKTPGGRWVVYDKSVDEIQNAAIAIGGYKAAEEIATGMIRWLDERKERGI